MKAQGQKAPTKRQLRAAFDLWKKQLTDETIDDINAIYGKWEKLADGTFQFVISTPAAASQKSMLDSNNKSMNQPNSNDESKENCVEEEEDCNDNKKD